MPCTPVPRPRGGIAIVCLRGRPQRRPPLRCSICNVPEHITGIRLCDAPVTRGKTCDQPVCWEHVTHVDPDTDYCPAHAALAHHEGTL
jgi:hypothetical protein